MPQRIAQETLEICNLIKREHAKFCAEIEELVRLRWRAEAEPEALEMLRVLGRALQGGEWKYDIMPDGRLAAKLTFATLEDLRLAQRLVIAATKMAAEDRNAGKIAMAAVQRPSECETGIPAAIERKP